MTDEDKQKLKQLEEDVQDLQFQVKRLNATLQTYFERQAKQARSNGRRQANLSQIEITQADFFQNLGDGLEVSG